MQAAVTKTLKKLVESFGVLVKKRFDWLEPRLDTIEQRLIDAPSQVVNNVRTTYCRTPHVN